MVILTHWGRVTHICVVKLNIVGSENGLSPGRRQAIIWTNAGILLIGPLGTNFSEILIEIHTFSFKKMHLKMSPGKCRPCCLGLNVLKVMKYFTGDCMVQLYNAFIVPCLMHWDQISGSTYKANLKKNTSVDVRVITGFSRKTSTEWMYNEYRILKLC